VIIFTMQIVVSDQQRSAALRSLSAMLGPTRVAPGCLDARLYADLGNRKALVLVEEWESHEQFEKHLDPDRLNTLVAAIELCCEAPKIHIDSVTRENGIDALAAHQYAVGGTAS
jgi:quinol monooxygenase YgiN